MKKGTSCPFLAVFTSENISGKYSIQLESCWHLYGIFRICLPLKSLEKLPWVLDPSLSSGTSSGTMHRAGAWGKLQVQPAAEAQLPKVL